MIYLKILNYGGLIFLIVKHLRSKYVLEFS